MGWYRWRYWEISRFTWLDILRQYHSSDNCKPQNICGHKITTLASISFFLVFGRLCSSNFINFFVLNFTDHKTCNVLIIYSIMMWKYHPYTEKFFAGYLTWPVQGWKCAQPQTKMSCKMATQETALTFIEMFLKWSLVVGFQKFKVLERAETYTYSFQLKRQIHKIWKFHISASKKRS
jgi:hypothetical protein